jgi:cell division protein FtsZ
MSMSLELQLPELQKLKPRITVVGVGGAGGNAVNNMIHAGLMGVDFVVANTDAQALSGSQAETRLQLGLKCTQGLGAGSRPEIGRAAAEETLEQIETALDGSHMCFITAGMGGGTGTGAAPIVAKSARERGILTVAVVTKPFAFEGARRMRLADEGIAELQKHVDTLIIIPNQNLFRIATPQTTFAEAFGIADEVLQAGVRSITDLMVMPGLINLDFADVRTVMSEMGKAMMGTGEAEGPARATEAAQAAIANPLLDEVSLRGAKGVIVNITGGMDLTLFEVDEAANHIRELVDPDANIIVGSAFNEELNGKMRVSVVATGIDAAAQAIGAPVRQAAPAAFAAAGSFHKPAVAPVAAVDMPAPVMAQAAPQAPAAPVIVEEEPLVLTTREEVVPQPAAPVMQDAIVPFPGTPVADPQERPYVPQPATAARMEPRVEAPQPVRTPLPEPVRAPSLFERMTNGFRKPTAEPVRDATAQPGQPGDDMFDIPDFLRRQAK